MVLAGFLLDLQIVFSSQYKEADRLHYLNSSDLPTVFNTKRTSSALSELQLKCVELPTYRPSALYTQPSALYTQTACLWTKSWFVLFVFFVVFFAEGVGYDLDSFL